MKRFKKILSTLCLATLFAIPITASAAGNSRCHDCGAGRWKIGEKISTCQTSGCSAPIFLWECSSGHRGVYCDGTGQHRQ